MKCRAARSFLASYLDGDLSAQRAADVQAHLTGCPDCSGELAALRQAVALVGTLDEVDPGPSFTIRVMASLRAQSEGSALPVAEPGPARLWPLGLVLGAAGLAATALVVWLISTLSLPGVGEWSVMAGVLGRAATGVIHGLGLAVAMLLEALARALATRPVMLALAAEIAAAMAVAVWYRRWRLWRAPAGPVMLAL
jgi:anti-sigma factor RsiW